VNSIRTGAVTANDTVIAIKFDRNSNETTSLLRQDVAFTITRRCIADENFFDITTPCEKLFSIENYKGDLDDLRSRTKTFWRTQRKDGEAIVIGVDSIEATPESDYIFLVYLGGDEFAVFAEPHFKYRNNVKVQYNYCVTSTNLPNEITMEANRLLRLNSNFQYNNISLNRMRKVTYELDDILSMPATKNLHSHAKNLKFQLEQKIKEIRSYKNKNNLSKEFNDAYQANLIEVLKAFVIENHCENTLSKINAEALRLTTDGFKTAPIGTVMDTLKSQKQEVDEIRLQINDNPCSKDFNDFLDLSVPPRVKISKCLKCNRSATLKVLEGVGVKKKQHEVSCTQCSNKVIGGRVGTEAILIWNQNNDPLLSVSDYNLLGMSGLSNEDAAFKIKQYEKLVQLKSREINLLQKITPGQSKSTFNKVRGMSRVISLFCDHFRFLISKHTSH
jgi:hypothetical protein|tara:strand:+ start:18862 stop:20199 length:1338 start_codon:yes stop_codon:yes gene_type:complete